MTDINIEYIINLWNHCSDEYREKTLQLLRENAPGLESTQEQRDTTE